ncbi:MAG: GH25 family lysozyme, partial [Liquorilactobacillus nagelii]|uniref:GH25 family lysozyme n=2 Tax=Liquorilactobacillus TaxID=2767888 RepID=UPI0039E84BDB
MKKQTLEKLIKSETTIQSKYSHDVLHTFLAGMVAAGVLLTISSNTPVHAAANDTNDVKTSLTMSSSYSSSSNQVTSSSVSSSSESANSATDEEDTNKSTNSTASSNASKAESVSDSKTSQDAQQTSANSQSSSQVSSSSSSAVSSSETVTNNSSSNENNVVAENSSSVASTALSTKDQNNSAVTNKKVLAAADTQVDSWKIGDASRPRVDAVDVSSYQDGMTQANFNELKAKGVKTVIVKVTQGNNYTNPYASQEINYAQNAGLNIMVYHYATFNSTDSAKQEANYLLQELNALNLAKTTRIFADMEDVGTSSDDVKDNLLNFFNVLNAAGYTDHAAYAYLNYQYLAQVIAAVGKQNIWLAQYPYTPSASNLKNTDYGAWQDSSQTELSGYDGYLDSSIDYNGLVVYQTANNGFIHQDANVYYYENNTKVTGQKKINNYWYYFDDATGAMVTGFKSIANQNKTVYYNSNGQMQYGQQQVNGHWYLFDNTTGAMKTGFQYIANQNKTVYYNNSGQMQYGQQQINGHWYLFDNTTGAMKTGFQYIANQNKTVYYNNNGQMQYGQQQINGHWYLFDSILGSMKTGFQYIANQNKTVYYNNNGQMQY